MFYTSSFCPFDIRIYFDLFIFGSAGPRLLWGLPLAVVLGLLIAVASLNAERRL